MNGETSAYQPLILERYGLKLEELESIEQDLCSEQIVFRFKGHRNILITPRLVTGYDQIKPILHVDYSKPPTAIGIGGALLGKETN